MEKYTYLLLVSGAVLVPLIFSFHPRLRFWQNIRYFLMANGITASLFLLWDVYFTHQGVWGFNDRYVMGIFVKGLPLEEILFFIFIPYACLFSYHCFGIWKTKKSAFYNPAWLTAAVSGLLLVLAAYNFDKFYTSVTFLLAGSFLLYLRFIKKPDWMGRFYFTYLVMLIPFFIINGILTGTGLDEPVVWYNSREIINLRLLTIPVEDAFYGLLLIGSNIFFYEFFLDKKESAASGNILAENTEREKLADISCP
jgi:lycopene cyclase domain-containing protein